MDFSEIKKKMSLIKVQAHDYLPWICNASIGFVLINSRMQVFILYPRGMHDTYYPKHDKAAWK
jgi:hypothetical protein